LKAGAWNALVHKQSALHPHWIRQAPAQGNEMERLQQSLLAATPGGFMGMPGPPVQATYYTLSELPKG
jgi:hypothetical protein